MEVCIFTLSDSFQPGWKLNLGIACCGCADPVSVCLRTDGRVDSRLVRFLSQALS